MNALRHIALLLSAFSILVLFPDAARADAEYFAKAGGWTVSRHEDSCSMYMEFEGPGSTTLFVAKYLDGHFVSTVANDNWTASEGQRYKVRYELGGNSYSTEKAPGISLDSSSGFASRFGSEFEQDFARSSTMYIFLDDQLIDQLSLKGTAAALTLVNRCIGYVRTSQASADRESRRWAAIPKDPFAPKPRKLSPPLPKGSPANWVTTNDYPTAALREHRGGRVSFELKVSAEGNVSACDITASSGSTDLDVATCAMFTRRARFTPATDANGGPIEGTWSSSMNWSIPE